MTHKQRLLLRAQCVIPIWDTCRTLKKGAGKSTQQSAGAHRAIRGRPGLSTVTHDARLHISLLVAPFIIGARRCRIILLVAFSLIQAVHLPGFQR